MESDTFFASRVELSLYFASQVDLEPGLISGHFFRASTSQARAEIEPEKLPLFPGFGGTFKAAFLGSGPKKEEKMLMKLLFSFSIILKKKQLKFSNFEGDFSKILSFPMIFGLRFRPLRASSAIFENSSSSQIELSLWSILQSRANKDFSRAFIVSS